jgi:hypothetical protein
VLLLAYKNHQTKEIGRLRVKVADMSGQPASKQETEFNTSNSNGNSDLESENRELRRLLEEALADRSTAEEKLRKYASERGNRVPSKSVQKEASVERLTTEEKVQKDDVDQRSKFFKKEALVERSTAEEKLQKYASDRGSDMPSKSVQKEALAERSTTEEKLQKNALDQGIGEPSKSVVSSRAEDKLQKYALDQGIRMPSKLVQKEVLVEHSTSEEKLQKYALDQEIGVPSKSVHKEALVVPSRAEEKLQKYALDQEIGVPSKSVQVLRERNVFSKHDVERLTRKINKVSRTFVAATMPTEVHRPLSSSGEPQHRYHRRAQPGYLYGFFFAFVAWSFLMYWHQIQLHSTTIVPQVESFGSAFAVPATNSNSKSKSTTTKHKRQPRHSTNTTAKPSDHEPLKPKKAAFASSLMTTTSSPLFSITEPPDFNSSLVENNRTYEHDIFWYPPYTETLYKYWESLLIPKRNNTVRDEVSLLLPKSTQHQLKFLNATTFALGKYEGKKGEDLFHFWHTWKRMVFSFRPLLLESTTMATKGNNSSAISSTANFKNRDRHKKQFHRMRTLCMGEHHVIPLANERDIDLETTERADCPTYNKKKDVDVGFLHIFKNAGTLIENQCHSLSTGLGWHVPVKSLFALVRDPIDHFLSGWAECNLRLSQELGPKDFEEYIGSLANVTYDSRISDYFLMVKWQYDRRLCGCSKHSFPQGNFLLDHSKAKRNEEPPVYAIDPRLRFIGDLSELKGVLELLLPNYAKRFEETPSKPKDHRINDYNQSTAKSAANSAADNELKSKYFSAEAVRESLSNKTLRLICDFVAIDYYLFDFEIPEACRDLFD